MPQPEFAADTPYGSFGYTVAEAPADARVAFIKKTYMHLAAAVYFFVALEFFIFKALPVEDLVNKFFSVRYAGLIMLAAFIGVSWIADRWARSSTSVGMQYAGLSLFVVAEAVIFVPLLFIAQNYGVKFGGSEYNVITAAAVITLLLFGILTAVVVITGKDFSFLRTALVFGTIAAFGLILAGVFLGFHLGFWFSAAMVLLASGYILYDTSNVMHHYRPGQHVAAALALFASVALMFWYVIQLLLSFASND